MKALKFSAIVRHLVDNHVAYLLEENDDLFGGVVVLGVAPDDVNRVHKHHQLAGNVVKVDLFEVVQGQLEGLEKQANVFCLGAGCARWFEVEDV